MRLANDSAKLYIKNDTSCIIAFISSKMNISPCINKTAKTSMLLNAGERRSDCLISTESIKNIRFPVSIRGSVVGGGSESASTLYHADVADLLYVIQHLLYNKQYMGPIQVKGMRYNYLNSILPSSGDINLSIDPPTTVTNVQIPPNSHLHSIASFIFAIENERTGELDLNTRMIIDYFSPARFKTGEYLFTNVGKAFMGLTTLFQYPVGIGFPGMRCPYVFEFFDVLSALLTHPNTVDRHPTSRNRQFTIKDLIPIRKGLTKKDYTEYTQLYQLLRSISGGAPQYIQPRRILVGQHSEWVAVSNKTYREELNSYLAPQASSSLQESDWTTKVPNGDIRRNNQAEFQQQLSQLQALLAELKFSPHAYVLDEKENIIFDIPSETVLMQWFLHKAPEYPVFMQKLSNIFKTPLILMVLESHTSTAGHVPPQFIDLTNDDSSKARHSIEGTTSHQISHDSSTGGLRRDEIDIVPLNTSYLNNKSV